MRSSPAHTPLSLQQTIGAQGHHNKKQKKRVLRLRGKSKKMASWFSSLNPIPAFPDFHGPYDVGTVDVEIAASDLPSPSAAPECAPSTVAFRIFYPCQKPTNHERPVRWIPNPQRATISAFARFLNAGKLSEFFSLFPQHLYYITIPAHRNAPLLQPPTSNSRWPVTFFSHGLAGSRNAYSHICGSLAANGTIVISMDHRDGSSPIQYIRATKDSEARTVDPVKISHTPSKEVYEGRDKQLRIRLWEITKAHEALLKIDAGEPMENLDDNTSHKRKERIDVLQRFSGKMDVHRPGKIAFAGHSFGACTTVQLVKSVFYSPERPYSVAKPLLSLERNTAILQQITPNTPTLLLDTWCLPLRSPDQAWLWERSLPSYSRNGPQGSNVLSVLSEAFSKWKGNYNDTIRAISPPRHATKSHNSRPIVPQWARLRDESPGNDSGYASEDVSPDRLSELRDGPLTHEGPHMFYPEKSQHFNQSDFGVLFPWLAKRLTKAEEPERVLELNVRAMAQVLREAGIEVAGPQDEEILRKDGGVRGWINVPVGGQAGSSDADVLDAKISITQDEHQAPRDDMVGGETMDM